jgi:uncharacterized membrane protein
MKRIAREQLNNRYRVPMGAFAAASAITAVLEVPFSLSLGENPNTLQCVITLIAEYLILLLGQVLSAGVVRIHLNMTRGGTVRLRDLFDPFRYGFDRYCIAALLLSLLGLAASVPFLVCMIYFGINDGASDLTLPLVITSVLSSLLVIYVALTCCLTYHLLSDYPEMRPHAAISESHRLMKRNRIRLFRLLFSFLGYGILLLTSLGVASLWIMPYMRETLVIFYLDVTGELDHLPVRSYETNDYRYQNTTKEDSL